MNSTSQKLVYKIFPRLDEAGNNLNVRPDLARYDAADIELVRAKMMKSLGFSHLISAEQVHGKRVVVVDRPDIVPGEADALITNQKGIGLMVMVADCQPVFLWAPERGVVAAVHCGWRGAVAGVLQETIQTFQEQYQVQPSELSASIGPSLGPCCSEFSDPYLELPRNFHYAITAENKVDFWKISQDILQENGLNKAKIQVANICTACNNHTWFSYRADSETAQGRFAAIIGLV